jgi:hypothetical protein
MRIIDDSRDSWDVEWLVGVLMIAIPLLVTSCASTEGHYGVVGEYQPVYVEKR